MTSTTTTGIGDVAGSDGGGPRPLLSVENLNVTFRHRGHPAHVVRDVSFDVQPGHALGVLGESGSGKSVTVKSLMGLLPMSRAQIDAGHAHFGDVDLLRLDARSRRRIMGSRISIIFQDALSALNPVQPVGRQIGEMYRVHRGYSRVEARKAAIAMMRRVRIPAAERRVDDHPHQFSGGMRQRICIAIALALDPDLVIADEPTTALDVTVQAQILNLLKEEQERRGMGLILISHDISVINEMTDDVAVMYGGRIIERGRTGEVLAAPSHPYTRGLAAASVGGEPGEPMVTIPGLPPNLAYLPPGCSFAPRCGMAQDICTGERPRLEPVESLDAGSAHTPRFSACHFASKVTS